MTDFGDTFRRPISEVESDGWTLREIAGGEYAWRQGEAATALAWVASGGLRLMVDGSERAVIGPGELLGEASVFARDERRTGDVQATQPTRLFVLERAAFEAHRRSTSEVYDSLLEEAASTLARRITETDAEGRQRHSGTSVSKQEGGVPLRPGRVEAGIPTAFQALLGLPTFVDVEPQCVEEIASVCIPLLLHPKDVLCREGEQASSMYVVAEGTLEVLLDTGPGSVFSIGMVSSGTLLGTAALFGTGERTASLVATQRTWVWELPRSEIEGLSREARRALIEALVVVLRGQLVKAHQIAMRARGPRGTVPLEDAMGQLQSLHAWQGARVMDVSLDHLPSPSSPLRLSADKQAQIAAVQQSVIGRDVALTTPFGRKRVVYADYTASGRSLSFIEDFLREQVMPLYANTHTEASASGLQTTEFREEARALIARSVGASDADAVIFTGSGATGAIDKLIGMLNLRVPHDLDERYHFTDQIPDRERPVVFVGPYEHHSNILGWRQSIVDLVILPLDPDGALDVAELERQLVAYEDRPLKIGSFSAASNVTGLKTDTVAIATLLHRHGALSLWDYAAAAPYVDIDMNPSGEGIDASLAYKDAVFISPHKFVGGPGTPGVLVIKRDLAANTVPAIPGGGTVDFVTWTDTLYTDDVEAREEAGTPAIIESIRAGLVFQLKDQIGAHVIEAVEHDYTTRATEAWSANPSIELLGNRAADRLSITSFMVRYGRSFVHYGFVVALLNDLFGIQARGGCSCAGPYGGMLFGLGPESGEMFLKRADEGWMSLKPGWARVNFNYFIGEHEFRYIVDAVHLVAAFGWALMPAYNFDPRSGLWTHQHGSGFEVSHLRDLQIGAEVSWGAPRATLPASALDAQLAHGREVLESALHETPWRITAQLGPPEFESARWFPLPHEVAEHLRLRQQGRVS